MNSAIITKIEYKPKAGGNYAEITIVPHSGTFSEDQQLTRAGTVFLQNVQFRIAKIDPDTDSDLEILIGKQNIFKITDSNGKTHEFGNSLNGPLFLYTKRIDGSPDGFNGYDCNLTRRSATAALTT